MTMDLSSKQCKCITLAIGYMCFIDWLKEAGPSGSGIELRSRVEQRQATSGTRVNTLFVMIPIKSCESTFSPFAAKYMVR